MIGSGGFRTFLERKPPKMKISPFKLERYFAKYEFSAEYILCASDCESMSIADLLNMEPEAAEKFKEVWLGYTESQGSPALRNEISRMYETILPEQVLVHSGAEEAIMNFMLAMLTEDDHVIVHFPCYQSLAEVAKGLGCQVTPWRAREEMGWGLDLDELHRIVRPSTRAVIVNIPHNPTGFLMPKEDFLALNHFVQENGLLLFFDEVYRESELDPVNCLPAACDQGAHAVSLGVTSKTYGLPGLRIGWIATKNTDVYNRMAALKDYTTICNAAPSEFLAELALRHRQELAQRNLNIIRSNLTVLDGLMGRWRDRFTWVRPRAGSIAYPKLIKGSVEEFCEELVRRVGVLLLPGDLFDDPTNHFRLGFGRTNLPHAVARLEQFLAQSP